MAHRMFNSKIIEKSNFLKMPLSSQALYFHLGMNADDDGIAEAYKVMRLIGANEDDLRVLAAREFIKVLNDDDVIFIMDWNHHNKIRTDRKVDSIYQELLIQIIPNIDVRKSTKHLCQTNDGQMSDNCQQNTRQDNTIQDNTSYVNTLPTNPFIDDDNKYPLINSLLPFLSFVKRPFTNISVLADSCEDTLQKLKSMTGDNFQMIIEKQINYGTNRQTLINSVNPVKDLTTIASNQIDYLIGKQQSPSYNAQPKVNLRPKMSDETTEYYHSYCKKRYEDEGLEWKGEVYNGQ